MSDAARNGGTPTPRVGFSVEDGIAWIAFDNPARHNALTPEMIAALYDGVVELRARDDVRVVVVRGAGERAFISGGDISSIGSTVADGRDPLRELHALAELQVPVIAMIQGYCMGGGVTIALDADLRMASEDAVFAVPAAKLGVGYGLADTASIVRAVGPGAASEILFTGGRFGAEDALRMGLVQRVVATDALEAEVRDLAATIVGNAPLSVRAAKAAIRHLTRPEDAPDEAAVRAAIDACWASDDLVEGRQAFLDKRPPKFVGH